MKTAKSLQFSYQKWNFNGILTECIIGTSTEEMCVTHLISIYFMFFLLLFVLQNAIRLGYQYYSIYLCDLWTWKKICATQKSKKRNDAQQRIEDIGGKMI